jgi:hypothetical protein
MTEVPVDQYRMPTCRYHFMVHSEVLKRLISNWWFTVEFVRPVGCLRCHRGCAPREKRQIFGAILQGLLGMSLKWILHNILSFQCLTFLWINLNFHLATGYHHHHQDHNSDDYGGCVRNYDAHHHHHSH